MTSLDREMKLEERREAGRKFFAEVLAKQGLEAPRKVVLDRVARVLRPSPIHPSVGLRPVEAQDD